MRGRKREEREREDPVPIKGKLHAPYFTSFTPFILQAKGRRYREWVLGINRQVFASMSYSELTII